MNRMQIFENAEWARDSVREDLRAYASNSI